MWTKATREETWNALNQPWDVIMIGGGITGAGVLREAVNAGFRALLLEAKDFAYGTSSRSSKLIHGGFRYLKNRQYHVTRESVREREWLLKEAEHLVSPLSFLLPNYEIYHTPDWVFGLGVFLYDIFAPKWAHRTFSRESVLKQYPFLNPQGLTKAFLYGDGGVDDARLVLRVLQEAEQAGGTALNYAAVTGFMKNTAGRVCGVQVTDMENPDRRMELQAEVVINATGPWGDSLRAMLGMENRLRKQRGSHLIFSHERFPLKVAVTLMHPRDRRAMFAFPWEGVTVIGTTDLDHSGSLDEPYATQEEIDYMLEASRQVFPDFHLEQQDVTATFSGLRPIVSTGAANPSAESRTHVVWEEDGLLTITGGKITTFRVMAAEVLNRAAILMNRRIHFPTGKRIFNPLQGSANCAAPAGLHGRYGDRLEDILAGFGSDDFTAIHGTPYSRAEIRYAARNEAVVHLEDLLLRRTRLGILLPKGGRDLLGELRPLIQPEMGWDDLRWQSETASYLKTWNNQHSPYPA